MFPLDCTYISVRLLPRNVFVVFDDIYVAEQIPTVCERRSTVQMGYFS